MYCYRYLSILLQYITCIVIIDIIIIVIQVVIIDIIIIVITVRYNIYWKYLY